MSTATVPLNLQNMPPGYAEELSARRAYIANVSDEEFVRTRTYGSYTIPGRGDRAYSLVEITPRRGTIDLGDKKIMDFPITPEEIAKDLCSEINIDAGPNSFLGVFVCGANGPTPAQLKDSHERMAKFYTWCLGEGDREWSRSRSMAMISELWVRAAKWLKQEREWAATMVENQECPGCGSTLRPGVAVCKDCGAILDREKALKLGILREEASTATDPEPTQKRKVA